MQTPPQPRDAHDILGKATSLLGERGQGYDRGKERSMPRTVSAFNAITGHNLTAEQGWLFMILLKAVRAQSGSFKEDNYDDLTAYASLMGEQAETDRKGV